MSTCSLCIIPLFCCSIQPFGAQNNSSDRSNFRLDFQMKIRTRCSVLSLWLVESVNFAYETIEEMIQSGLVARIFKFQYEIFSSSELLTF